ncbi:hypothetical protein SAMN05444678_1267 [Sphingomonas sp. YR710]|uniref:hypothetical protein n=1 Tax=Sphingomonas sp. YR710 TaxID=1882773 RepID=UPI00088EDD7B|nr:hypothetical protein [Sphingomonas sp. YR710]SDD84776.1 hypothetical protein SAMN05444678_1267 [Sphingomonas sp. YR710]
MLIITDPADVQDPTLRDILNLRFDQLSGCDCDIGEIARFHIVQPGDSIDAIEAELGFPIMTNMVDGACYGHPDFEPSWEHMADHCGTYELVYILDDSGFGHVVFVQDVDGTDWRLLSLCREYAARGQPEGPERP